MAFKLHCFKCSIDQPNKLLSLWYSSFKLISDIVLPSLFILNDTFLLNNLSIGCSSERAEVSRKSINAIENGIYVPSTVLALKIADTLSCKVEDIFKLPE